MKFLVMDGIVVIDKPSGKTSYAVVSEVRRLLGARKAGHTGTLDPLTTGVLPVCINEATKLVQFFSPDSKEYRATMLLGVETDTLDMEGKIIAECEPRVARDEIEEVLHRFVGKIEQLPPHYSAVKFQGKPLYKWARRGIAVDLPPRTVEVYTIVVEEIVLPYVTFTVSCGSGTYIRSLCSDVGKILGCGACLASLRRTRSGCFHEGLAVSIEGIDNEKKRDLLAANILPLTEALPELPAINVDQALVGKLREGYQPDADALGINNFPFLSAGDIVKFMSPDHCLVAIGKMLCASEQIASLDGEKRVVKIMRVFNC
ncbi:MAG: tRNA pseudouridine(55) synthase TruB [Syntrophobacterales bacterium CG_4_8_14_3_um_filter_49_14]|nr:MAG: tRNA pseudouridine(55) synthase TruB [Syntrophobacterales bacterium CG23_combo_of_CG06-09_8_20_14_all_48_27]PJA48163.1 MAG: tRNA pseudouridine(55) synthase TruB [Syntrophobacterales bacterium CG_4_9_14_3_um_filter_49_8]PJC72813.1 MAG: tRNA pseudouridine(55) synthase TruB [Syntrophobacterales bacterium CG_4_8_14_3_um_filter_49_14]